LGIPTIGGMKTAFKILLLLALFTLACEATVRWRLHRFAQRVEAGEVTPAETRSLYTAEEAPWMNR
jgi:hypothetical protein